MTFSSMTGKVIDFFFPPKCISCGKLLHENNLGICPDCFRKLPENHKVISLPAGFQCRAPYLYSGEMKTMIRKFKFSDKPYYADTLGLLLAETLSACEADFVTWVPVSTKRKFKRGYDQAQLLAKRASLSAEKNCIGVLKKKHIKRQSSTNSREERFRNVQGAFSVSNPELIAGKRIVLIDDICTTGATLSEAAKALMLAGAAGVECVTLALTEELKDIGEIL